MALPILLFGAALSALTINELAQDRVKIQYKRRRNNKAETLAGLTRHESPTAQYPSDLLVSMTHANTALVAPKVGAIVCCGIGGVLDHTGIYVGDNTIVELAGNGLVKGVSMERFLTERSGKHIFIACDSNAQPLINEAAAQQAIAQIFNYYDYDMINNNCHRFIWQCFAQNDNELTTFKTLSRKLANYFNRVVYWDVCKTDY